MSWENVTFGSVCDLVNGKAFKPSDWSPSGVPIIRIQNLNGSDKPFNFWAGPLGGQVRVSCGDLLLAWSGTPGTSFGAHIWNGGDSILNQHIFRCDINHKRISPEWARFAVNTQLNQLIHLAHGGVGLKHVTRGVVEELEIPLPPLAEQRRIAEVLDRAEALRAKRRATLAQLDSLTQSIFLEMFGDPIKNEKKFPIRPMIELIDPERPISYGILMPGPEQVEGIKYVRVVDMRDGGIELSNIRKTTDAISNAFRRSLLRPGDLLMSIRGHVGRFAIVPPEIDGANITQDTARLAIVGASSVFVRECLRTSGFQQWMAKHTKGVAVRGINLGDVKLMPIVLPPQAAQDNFARQAATVEKLKSAQRASLAELDALFASLQHRAFRGEL